MTIDMNNIYVTHKGKEVSIAQHRHEGDWPDQHEIAIIPETKEGWSDATILMYGKSLNSLINRLMEIRDEIDEADIHQPSSEGNAARAQVTASSAAQKGQ